MGTSILYKEQPIKSIVITTKGDAKTVTIKPSRHDGRPVFQVFTESGYLHGKSVVIDMKDTNKIVMALQAMQRQALDN